MKMCASSYYFYIYLEMDISTFYLARQISEPHQKFINKSRCLTTLTHVSFSLRFISRPFRAICEGQPGFSEEDR
jgi:hypothetical protein